VSDITIELFKLKQEYERRKLAIAESQGRLTELYRQLRDDFKCLTPEEADKRLAELETEVDKLQEQIEEDMTEIKLLLGLDKSG
jgi:predicted  nucleic acid-binding Zn-ribbon protein